MAILYFSPLMKKMRLLELGYNVKHSFDNLSIKLGFYKDSKVGEFDSAGNLTFEKDITEKIRSEISTVYSQEFKKLQDELADVKQQLAEEKWYATNPQSSNIFSSEEIAEEETLLQMHDNLIESAIAQNEQEGISYFENQTLQNHSNPAHEDFKDTGETTSQLSRQEAVLIATLLKSDDCKELTSQYNCRYAVDTLMKKISDQYPDVATPINELPINIGLEEDFVAEQ